MNLSISMEHKPGARNTLLDILKSQLGSCITICQSAVPFVLSLTFLLSACNPSTTNNSYHNSNDKTAVLPNSGLGGGSGGGNGSGGSTGDGGGGQGVLCTYPDTDKSKVKTGLFVRDIYEAVSNHKRQMKTIANNFSGTDTVSPEAIKVLTDSIKSYFGPASGNLEFSKDKFWTDFVGKISFLDDDRELFPSQDANSPIALPKTCRIVQIAYWDESSGSGENGTLYVNKKFWQDLDQLNKIGLLAHEFFFKQARKAQYKNSDNIRYKVGQLLSQGGLKPLFEHWDPSLDPRVAKILPASMEGFKFCEGTSTDDPTAKIQLYQYRGKDKLQHFTIPLLTSGSINSNFLQPANFSFDQKKEEDLVKATDLLVFLTDHHSEDDLDHPLKNYSRWTSLWYDFSGLISDNITEPTLEDFQDLQYELIEKKEQLWTGSIPSPTKSIKISLINPSSIFSSFSKKEVQSRDALVGALNNALKLKIEKCGQPSTEEIDGAIAILKNEIEDSIAIGQHPEKFLKWTASIQKMDSLSMNQEYDKCTLSKDSKITEDLPNLIYSVALNSFDRQEIENVLSEASFYDQTSERTELGKISVQQDDSKLDFSLQCKDYTTQYAAAVRSTGKYSGHIKAKKNVIVKLWEPDENSHIKISQEDQVKEEKKRKITAGYISRYAAYLRFTNESIADVKYSNMNTINFDVPRIFLDVADADEDSFKSDLINETNIQMNPCTGDYSKSRGGLSPSVITCAIVRMITHKNTYMIHFSYFRNMLDTSDLAPSPQLHFIRLVPENADAIK